MKRLVPLLSAVLLLACRQPKPSAAAARPDFARTELAFPDGKKIQVELASSPKEREYGYMFKTRLSPDDGMLFVFPAEQDLQFWMKNTLVDLDMAFIGSDKRITVLHENVPRSAPDTPEANLARRFGSGRYVLELPAGAAKRHKLKAGDSLRFDAADVRDAPAAAVFPKGSLALPIIRQATSYSCGAASLLSVLYFWNVFDGPEGALYKRLGTTEKDGTEPAGIVRGARSFGLNARMKEGASLEDLEAAVRAGETVILDLQAWRTDKSKGKAWGDIWEEGHYVVLAGLDAKYVYAMDPAAGPAYAYLPRAEFLERWHDYEDRGGPRREYRHLAIFISGKAPLRGYPAPLVRMD